MLRYLLIGLAILAVIPAAWFAWWLLSPLITDTEVNEEFPLSAEAFIPSSMTRSEVEDAMDAAASLERPVDEEMPAMPSGFDGPTTPTPLLTGNFRDADSFHKGSGTATAFELGEGLTRILRLEDFEVTNGPDLRVLLVNAPNPDSHSDLEDAGYVELGKLKGNIGSQNYDIPDDLDLSEVRSVVIYCNPFRVVFSVATLEAETG